MATIKLTVRHAGFASPALNYTGTAFVEFDTDQVTTEGRALHTEVVGVYRFRRGKLVVYREFLFAPSVADEIWGAKPSRAA